MLIFAVLFFCTVGDVPINKNSAYIMTYKKGTDGHSTSFSSALIPF